MPTLEPSPSFLFVDAHAPTRAKFQSSMRRLAREMRASQWLLGIVDESRDCIEFFYSSAQVDIRTALDILWQIPQPETAGAIAVAPADVHGKILRRCLVGAMTLEGQRSLRIALLRESDAWHSWSETEKLRPHLEQIAQILSVSPVSMSDASFLSLRNHPHPVLYVLNRDFEVEFQWHALDVASIALSRLLQPVDGRLPRFLESPVRRLTALWDFSNADACVDSSVVPIPGILLRVIPVGRKESVSACVLVEPSGSRRTIEQAALSFNVSDREREVLYLLLDGYSIEQIAAELGIAGPTVRDHVKRMIVKTNARNRMEMAAKFLGWRSIRDSRLAGDEAADTGAVLTFTGSR